MAGFLKSLVSKVRGDRTRGKQMKDIIEQRKRELREKMDARK